MIVTDDSGLAERARLLREYGWADGRMSLVPGWNSRLDEVQAAVLRVKLRYLDADNATRARLAQDYDQALRGTGLGVPKRRPDATHVHHLYVCRCSERDELQTWLKAGGVGALVHYPVPIHMQPAYQGRLRGSDDLPETERAARQVLSLPIYPELGDADLGTVVAAVRSFPGPHHD
jgi:dTDP-4-amino-4,6-dideoxygalactose transaminase